MAFTTADTIIVVAILFLALKGIVSGGVREFFSTLGLLGAIFISSHLSDKIANILKANLFHTTSDATLKFLSFITLLATIWWLISFIGKLVVNSIDLEPNPILAISGYGVALIKYFAIISLILYVLMQSSAIQHKRFGRAINHSYIYNNCMERVGAFLLNSTIKKVK